MGGGDGSVSHSSFPCGDGSDGGVVVWWCGGGGGGRGGGGGVMV